MESASDCLRPVAHARRYRLRRFHSFSKYFPGDVLFTRFGPEYGCSFTIIDC